MGMNEQYTDFKHLNAGGRWCMTLKALTSSMIMIIILTAVRAFLVKIEMDPEYRNLINIIYAFITAVLVIMVILKPTFSYARYRYRIDHESVEIVEGWLWTEHEIIPLNRLHQVSIEEGPVDRLFKLSDVKIVTAGGNANLRFLPREEAQIIAESLKKKINELAVMKASPVSDDLAEHEDGSEAGAAGEAYDQ